MQCRASYRIFSLGVGGEELGSHETTILKKMCHISIITIDSWKTNFEEFLREKTIELNFKLFEILSYCLNFKMGI